MRLLIQLYLGSQLAKDLPPFQNLLINEKQFKPEFKYQMKNNSNMSHKMILKSIRIVG